MAELNTHWLSVYRQAHYSVDGFLNPIQVGCHSAEADAFLADCNLDVWCYVTAFNPRSVLLDLEENRRRNADLQALIAALPHRKGLGLDADGNWPAEESFLIAGLDREAALALGRRFEQNAVLFGVLGGPAELLWVQNIVS